MPEQITKTSAEFNIKIASAGNRGYQFKEEIDNETESLVDNGTDEPVPLEFDLAEVEFLETT